MAQVQVPARSLNGGANQFAKTSLYVGDLNFDVTDTHLFLLFNRVGQVASARVCMDWASRSSLGYGFVNYKYPGDAARALKMLNYTPINGKPIRIMYSQCDPSIRKSSAGNIFIKNLDESIDNKSLHEIFSTFGTILSCKVAMDPSGRSKGHGFVRYDNEESAQKAIEKLNGMLINDEQVFVGPFLRIEERESALNETTSFNKVYVKNLSEATTEDGLKKIFGQFGPTTSLVVMRDANGKSKCFGFVNFKQADDAARAVEALNGKKFDDKEWYVGKAQKKSERVIELRRKFEQSRKEAADEFQGANLYVKNLDDSIDDEKLKELFSPFGTIKACKVLRLPDGVSRGSGFVAFSTPEEASKALSEMLNKMVLSKPIYVAHAQSKEDRKAKLLEAQISQMRPVSMASVGPRVPMYPPRLDYQRQLVASIRPSAAFMPNFNVPMVQQGRQGGRCAGIPQQTQQPMPVMPQMMFPRDLVYRHPPPRGMPHLPDVGGRMMSMPMQEPSLSQPAPVGTLGSALANASRDKQRTTLGNSLYPLVEQLQPNAAAMVTGMLLEMDQVEVLHSLESLEALKEKVAEAIEVLRIAAQQQASDDAADQLGSLSLE
ncbi:polyadenylate-binding protein 8-like [Punica granatum]|uniref:Polyadenylate-binding protein n=2 Tax=Punica granatum TaxID=22663 RepID=A0A218XWR5_PUNGR|nr:polyadenylate-binding protein 8-like [Punica granatum]OWM89497.1 hypothetical protein CDL15_Pgr024245 [Punica granatum]PKI53321.1 hypothetical protein CRG98_026258 [Punica granatum]